MARYPASSATVAATSSTMNSISHHHSPNMHESLATPAFPDRPHAGEPVPRLSKS
jgi:hypothetical protein